MNIDQNINQGRYLKATSVLLCNIRDELIEIETQRVMLVERTAQLIAKAREFDFDRPTVGHLEALTYNPPKTDTSAALAYLDTRMYQEKKTNMVMPGMQPPGRMPGL